MPWPCPTWISDPGTPLKIKRPTLSVGLFYWQIVQSLIYNDLRFYPAKAAMANAQENH